MIPLFLGRKHYPLTAVVAGLNSKLFQKVVPEAISRLAGLEVTEAEFNKIINTIFLPTPSIQKIAKKV